MVWRITIRVGNRKGAALNCCALLSVVHRCSKRQRTVGSAANPAADIYEFRIENMENREFASLAVWIECTGRICSETGATRARDGGDCDRDQRVSEGQRFMTTLLSEQAPVLASHRIAKPAAERQS